MLRRGGVVLYPTDTLYGLGADAISSAAVIQIARAKGRDERKPIHAIVADIAMARRFGEIPDIVETLARELPKGKITFVVKKNPAFDTGILRGPTFGFRIPDNDLCIAMLRAFDGPITATSANAAGALPAGSIDGMLAQLHAQDIDLVIDAGELPVSAPSTVLDLTGEMPRILREAAVSALELRSYIPLL